MSTISDSIRVLHVDDEPDFADMAAEFLERQDDRLDVKTATSASDALTRLADNTVDCIVSDFDMPGKNGIEFLEAVREEYPDLPFILYTGKGSEEVASDAISAGVTEYLQKETGTSQYEVLAKRIENAVERQRAQKAAAETEQRLQTIAENTNDILWKFTADWDELLFINSPYEELWGRSIDELRNEPHSFLKGIHPDDRTAVKDAMSRLSTGDSIDLEFQVNADEDFGRWVAVQGEPVMDATGEVKKVVGFARDITERKQREQKLAEQRADLRLFERAVEGSTDLIGAVDTEYNLIFANERHREFHGFKEADIVGHPVADVIGDPWESEVKPRVDRALAGEVVKFDMERTGADGEVRSFDLRFYPLPGENGTIVGVVGTMRDITERKERERELEEKSRQLEAISRSTSEAIYIKDTEGYYQFINESGAELFGLSANELIGKHNDELFDAESAAEIRADDKQIIESGQGMTMERERFIDGEKYVFLDAKYPYRDGGGEIIGIIGVSPDITERKEYEWELQQRNERLDEFASVVSHDLRNPLNVAEGRLELAREEYDSAHLDDVSRALDRMATLIDDLLTIAREGKSVETTEPVDLTEFSEKCWQNVETRDATLVVECEKVIRADESRLEQLLENLIRNAVEHGGKDSTVTIGDVEDGFYVADDGPGIPEEKRKRVFSSGYSRTKEGTGFGLSIVRDIVDAHGWETRVTESSDGGARFEISGVKIAAE